MLCGVADSQAMLIAARLLQGVGGAVASSVILAIIVTEFPGAAERAKAMGMYAFVSAGGGSIGLLAGGALTQSLDWHWIFFVNVPIGALTLLLGSALIDENEGIGLADGVDVLGSVLITLATVLGAYAIVKSSEYGLLSARTLGVGGASLALLAAFFALESRISNPIMPLRILRLRMLMGSSLVRGLLVTGMFSAFFLGSLYLERVLGYDAIETGLAFMPLTAAIGVMSMGLSARAMARFGALRTLTVGLATIVVGLLLLAGEGMHASYFPGLFFAFLLIGLGAGASFMPLLDSRHVRRPAARRRPGIGNRQRLGPAVRGHRPGDARDDRDRPHQDVDGEGVLARQRADGRLPPRVPGWRGSGGDRRARGAAGPAATHKLRAAGGGLGPGGDDAHGDALGAARLIVARWPALAGVRPPQGANSTPTQSFTTYVKQVIQLVSLWRCLTKPSVQL